ncbi:IQ and ubiquitin-like domain-containing protein [Metopolophium dirhodum]|uniref:IQ and ubiquitin-like domain-containing protein n=1 Tax=Metopolophium dirhodum TaxID=44670 RepID=UPI00298F4246|nr:IQ and ubiquitin-like domain-containing protein [Metopolophium dirhodum]
MIEITTSEHDNIDRDTKMYSDLCIPPNQYISIPVQVTLPNNNTLSTNFALSDTILDVKRFILPALHPKIKNIQQIKCVMHDGHKVYETNDYTVLKQKWNNCPIQISVSIKHHKDIEKMYEEPKASAQPKIHPEYGNVLDTNATMPKHTTGYRNKNTGRLYRNTIVQTVYEDIDFNSQYNENTISISIQTIQTKDGNTESVVECGTQTESMDILRSLNVIREITPCPVILPDANRINKLDKYARIIQKSVRLWMTRMKINHILEYYYYKKQLTCDEEKNLKNIIRFEQSQNKLNLQYPTKTKDFEALYSAIHDHYKNIKSNVKNKSPKCVIRENKEHLKKELECFKEITKQRNEVNEIAKDKKIFGQLYKISKPIIMTRSNGETISIKTPETYQAKQLMELYIGLKRNDLNKDERTKLLLKLQETLEPLKEIDLTKQIINLLKRELTMLNVIQIEDKNLKILRKRIEISFQRILKQPEINPAITSKMSKPINFIKCYNCRKLKTLNRFVMKLNLTKAATCKDCNHLYRITIDQIVLTPHENILTNIKTTEAQLCTKTCLAFFLNAEDIYYLVTIIWKGKSAISDCNDIIQLRLVRWNKELEWSPSNTILLSIEEAYFHSKIRNINKMYSSTFIDNINFKHIVAKKYFKGLIEKAEECDRNIKRNKRNN